MNHQRTDEPSAAAVAGPHRALPGGARRTKQRIKARGACCLKTAAAAVAAAPSVLLLPRTRLVVAHHLADVFDDKGIPPDGHPRKQAKPVARAAVLRQQSQRGQRGHAASRGGVGGWGGEEREGLLA